MTIAYNVRDFHNFTDKYIFLHTTFKIAREVFYTKLEMFFENILRDNGCYKVTAFPWFLCYIVTQITLRTNEGKQDFYENDDFLQLDIQCKQLFTNIY